MIINHNMNALNAHRQMMGNVSNSGKAMEKLSSGLRINRAGDDAAGLAISEKMRGQIRGLDQATRNSQDGISMIQTAEGSLNETHSILQRMKELATQAASDTNTKKDRGEIQNEINQLTSEINRIGNTTEFNTQKVLDGGAAAKAAGIADGKTDGAAKSSYAVAGTDLGTLSNTNKVTVTAGTSDEFKITLDGTTDKTIKLAAVDYDGSAAGKKVEDLVKNINDKISADADLKDKVKAELKDGKLTFTSTEAKFEIKAGSNDALAALKVAAAKGTEVKPDTTGAAGTTNAFTATLQIGANEGQAFKITINDMRAEALGISKKIDGKTEGVAKSSYAVAGTDLGTLSNTNKVTVTAGTSDEFKITLDGTTDKTIKLAAVDYDGSAAGKKVEDLVKNINDKISADADLKDKVKAELKDGKLTFTSTEAKFEIKAGSNDALAALKVAAAKGTEVKPDATGAAGTFAKDGKVTNGTTDATVEAALDMSSHESSTASIKILDEAIAKVSTERSTLGAYQNRLEHTINNLGTSSENLSAAESRIRDVDMAKEMMNFSKNNILSQASQAMLAQAKSQPEAVLQLLR